ncbi:MAG: Glu-tRNA(Gln) amidotransferase GatDE subunit D, partial [Halobacteriaceae archaeon]
MTEPGDRVRVERDGVTHEGIVLPSSNQETVVIKRSGGYNVGIDREESRVEVIESANVTFEGGEPEERSTIEFD